MSVNRADEQGVTLIHEGVTEVIAYGTGAQGPPGPGGTAGADGGGMSAAGYWSATSSYTKGEVVLEAGPTDPDQPDANGDGCAHWCIADDPGNHRPSSSQGTFWVRLTNRGDQGDQGQPGDPGEGGVDAAVPRFMASWKTGQDYLADDVVEHNGMEFIARADHTSTSSNGPEDTYTANDTWAKFLNRGKPGKNGSDPSMAQIRTAVKQYLDNATLPGPTDDQIKDAVGDYMDNHKSEFKGDAYDGPAPKDGKDGSDAVLGFPVTIQGNGQFNGFISPQACTITEIVVVTDDDSTPTVTARNKQGGSLTVPITLAKSQVVNFSVSGAGTANTTVYLSLNGHAQ